MAGSPPGADPVPLPGSLPSLARGPLAAGLGALVVVLIWASSGANGYGYHRDELYFLSAGRHPAWGYPDQPPLTPLLARLTEVVHPHSLVALRVPAILAALGVGVTLLAALLARELGGAAFAQLTAALAVGSGVFTLMSGHLLATSTVDVALQVLLVWLVVRILRTGRHALWPAVGAVLGLGLLNKQLPAFLAASLVVGILLSPAARPALRSRYLYLAGVVVAAAWLPVLWWQARHGWPQLTLAGQIREEYGQAGERIGFAATQFVLFGIGAAVLWVTGVVRLLRDPGLSRYRPLACAWVTLMVVFALTAGQVYYAAGIYPALIAAGAVAAERWRHRRLLVAWTAVGAVVMLPASLPVLPPRVLDDTVWSGLAEPLRESVGWPGLAGQVAAVRRSLPEAQRATAVVVTSNYGEAGAIEEYGPALGVPRPAYSGHNGFAAWGPPPEGAGPVILVWQGEPSPWFTGCSPRGRVLTGVDNEEGEEASVHLCTGPVGTWAQAWPRLTRLRA